MGPGACPGRKVCALREGHALPAQGLPRPVRLPAEGGPGQAASWVERTFILEDTFNDNSLNPSYWVANDVFSGTALGPKPART
jgi:hypothetical protein